MCCYINPQHLPVVFTNFYARSPVEGHNARRERTSFTAPTIMKSNRILVPDGFIVEHQLASASVPVSGALMQQKCEVKRVSQSARAKHEVGPSPFGFIPSSAPVVVRRWPKL